MYEIFHFSGKIPVDSDLLNRYNKGTNRTNLHCIKKIFDILSGSGQVL